MEWMPTPEIRGIFPAWANIRPYLNPMGSGCISPITSTVPRTPEGKDGVKYWSLHFGDRFFAGFSAQEKDEAIARISQAQRRSGVRMHFMQITNACESLQRRFQNFRVDFLNRMVNNMKNLNM